MSGTVTVGSVLGFLGKALDVSANLLVVIDYFTSTMEPEVSKIYGYTYDTRENLKEVMKELEVPYKLRDPEDIPNNWEKATGSIKRTNDSLNKARMLNSEMYTILSEETSEITGEVLEKSGYALRESCEGIEENTKRNMDRNVMMIDKTWEEVKEAIKVSGGMHIHNTKEANDRRLMMMKAIPGLIEKLDAEAKEIYEKTIEIYKNMPIPIPSHVLEDGTTPADDGQAKADMEKVSGLLTKETDTAQTPTITEADAELIADKIIAKLNGEKAIESADKTADVVSNEEVANMVTLLKDEVANMATMYNNQDEGTSNLLAAVGALQKQIDPAAGSENVLSISLSEEDKIFISTQIAEKLNEEEEIVPAENAGGGVTNEELSIEVRDSKRSLKGEIGDIKAMLKVLLKLIEKKAMTFDDIYKMVFRKLTREHEMQTGRRIG